MLRGFIVFFFGGLPKALIDTQYRKLFFLGLKLLLIPGNKFRVDGNQFIINDKLGFFWQFYEIFYREHYLFNEGKQLPQVILDCGANIGLSAFWFVKNFPNAQVHCFEPDSQVFDKLRHNLASFSNSQLTLYNEAVYIKDDTLNFIADGRDGGMLKEDSSHEQTVKVKAIDFKKFLNSFDCIDMLKIDIEGAEEQLIPHIKDELHKVQNIFIEYHQREVNGAFLSDILKILEEQGFHYHIEVPVKVKHPMTNKRIINGCYLQVNIFASKV
ncbi:MAG: FkbM family methyltransferase [Bacteroidia bacterium]|nr:FkbM family methyltransferase [Bacteroidia bacterium]MCO5254349.1 FkbM family methyltransferase [Bacteroidota bacterium]MCZ2129534.1 FkbM family methyltransferase [Bacteroidia bacterium]